MADPLPELGVDAAGIKRGEELFNTFCLPCHGILAMTTDVVPDLRFASTTTHEEFQDIVLGGTRVHNGMASFADVLKPEDVKLVQAYVIERAREAAPTK